MVLNKRSSLANGLVNRLNEQRHPGRVVASFARFSVHAHSMRQFTKLPHAPSGVFSLNGASVMAKRKAISTRTRFEVFKRDSFKCQYCGSSAPDVLLEVDHINPVANGGTNDILNLITACEKCNGGKSDKLLSANDAMDKKRSQLELMQQRREQLDMMFQWQESLADITGDVVKRLADKWTEYTKYCLAPHGLTMLKKWVKKFPLEDILEAMDIAVDSYLKFDKTGQAIHESVDNAFTKMGGICHYKSVERKDPDLREIYRVRSILRNRGYVNEGQIVPLLRRAIQNNVDMEKLRAFAAQSKSWSHFRDTIYQFCEHEEAQE